MWIYPNWCCRHNHKMLWTFTSCEDIEFSVYILLVFLFFVAFQYNCLGSVRYNAYRSIPSPAHRWVQWTNKPSEAVSQGGMSVFMFFDYHVSDMSDETKCNSFMFPLEQFPEVFWQV